MIKGETMKISDEHRAKATLQIEEQRILVDFDVAEYTIELIVLKFQRSEIFIPEYQRKFVWDDEKKSLLIESIILGLPIPFIFVADVDGDLEIVDGTQRIRTLCSFKENKFALKGLEVLSELNGFKYSDIPPAEQKRLQNRTLRTIILSSKADLSVRFEVFQRINSRPKALTDAEFRKGAFQGPFYRKILELSNDPTFLELCPVAEKKKERGEAEELVLRFFAYGDKYTDFIHDVGRFLNNYLMEMEKKRLTGPQISSYENRFRTMLAFAQKHMPNAFIGKKANQTPRVRFEALSVGIYLALQEDHDLTPSSVEWIESKEFAQLTRTDGSNSGPRLRSRIEYVRDSLLSKAV
ncbi:MAG: DUF262 domain-containing protein [Enhygromyxa sp.]